MLAAISPIDGRYAAQTSALAAYFSEESLIRYRLRVEIEYFIALCEIPLKQLQHFPKNHFADLRKLYTDFHVDYAVRIKDIEKVTNHDVKAVEYFIKEEFDRLGLAAYKEFIHFGLTSQDINNTAQPLALKEALESVFYPELKNVIEKLRSDAKDWKNVPLLARTHGQPASPTILGKEMMVYIERLEKQLELALAVPHAAKFGGATGNFNALHIAYPGVDWRAFADHFVNSILGLNRSHFTTQIEHYDMAAALFDALKRINTILVDLSRDMWTYISMDYFKQQIKAGEVGSSAMPHKVNPIDFENAEGNLGLANAIYEHLAAKLPISRLQRDLTDSTVTRNVGVPVAHSLIALKSLQKGLNKLLLNKDLLIADLENHWEVAAEAIQTILRREAYPNPYEALKELTRTNAKITKESIHAFIDTLNVSDTIKHELKQVTPQSYTGLTMA